jgi:hypothetical protein
MQKNFCTERSESLAPALHKEWRLTNIQQKMNLSLMVRMLLIYAKYYVVSWLHLKQQPEEDNLITSSVSLFPYLCFLYLTY